MDHALQNAREALIRKSAETLNQIQLLQEFSARFNLPRIPKRIEVYDNSHTTGSSAVGVMIVWGPDGFIKNQYRKFNISSPDIAPGDDYAMMRKVMNRRFGSVDRNSAQIEARGAAGLFVWPDVILVDGGVGQLNAVLEVLKRVDPDETIFPVAIAKGKDRLPGKERFFLRDGTELVLNPRDRVFYFLQRLRDESHRFALGSHRIRRKKEFSGSKLNEISGIGPARKRALLRYFGTLQAISRSGIRDLMLVDGISQALAIQIHKHFHET